ncbi:MAG: FG-GAP-like repeat-containing protein [Candidatus Kapaibacterium sp.]
MTALFVAAVIIFFTSVLSADAQQPVIFQMDNGQAQSYYSNAQQIDWEENCFLEPSAPGRINKIMIYYSGDEPALDTVYILNDVGNGQTIPTKYVRNWAMLTEPQIIDYTGQPGWYEIDLSSENLRSDGLDAIVINHTISANGPFFTFDSDGNSPLNSYLVDVNTPNPNFYNIRGSIYTAAGGNYLVRMEITYDYALENGSPLPPPPPVMVDVTKEAGLVDASGELLKSVMATIADWNGDGYDDIAIGSRFYENNGDGTFTDVSEEMNLKSPGGDLFHSTIWADLNNDGLADCFGVRGGFEDAIFRQKYDGSFEDKTDPDINQNKPTVTPLFLDYDNDGLLDIFVANGRRTVSGQEVYYQDALFKNNGNFEFTDVTEGSAIEQAENNPFYDCWSASVSDYNGDNLPDPFVATYRLAPDLLYRNDGSGEFTEVGRETGARGVPTSNPVYFGHGMGSDWADFDNDGDLDLAVGNLGHPDERGASSNPSLILVNSGAPDYEFTSATRDMGLMFYEMNSGILWADLDLDGFQDIIHCVYSYDPKGEIPDKFTRFYINSGPEGNFRLLDKTWEFGSLIHGAWSPLRFDYDNDGDLDILIASSQENLKLFRNDLDRKGSWIAFRLKGSPENGVNMDAFGTSIRVKAGDDEYYRVLPGTVVSARASQNTNELHFGLGDNFAIDGIEVKFPDGKVLNLDGLPVNSRYVIHYNGDIENGPLAPPALVYPGDRRQGFPVTINFDWLESGLAEIYEIKISGNKDFSSTLYHEFVQNATTLEDIDLTNRTVYYWKVRAISNSDTSRWSPAWAFVTGKLIPTSPGLVRPSQGAEHIPSMYTFEWTEAEYDSHIHGHTTYDFRLATDQNFDNIVIDANSLSAISYTVDNLEYRTEYFWQVRANNEDVHSPWSEVYSFNTLDFPDEPLLTIPANNATGVKSRPQFHWEDVPGAVSYHIQISGNEAFTNIFKEAEQVSINRYQLIQKLEAGSTYYWRVRGNNAVGSGDWSEIFSFTTEPGGSVDEFVKPEIASVIGLSSYPNPMEDETVITLSLTASSNLKLAINDYSGNTIAILHNNSLGAGTHRFIWSASGLPSGVYYYNVELGNSKQSTGKIIKLK